MIKAKIQLLVLGVLYCAAVKGQETDTVKLKEGITTRSFGLLTGITFGKSVFAEIGLSRNSKTIIGYHPFSSAYFVSTELKFGDRFIIGPKIGAWIAGGVAGLAIGVNLIYYSDFNNGKFVFRPEVGLGFENAKLVYGYNAFLTTNQFDRINRNVGSLVYCFKLKRLKSKIADSR